MISRRTLISLAQFPDTQREDFAYMLLEKHGVALERRLDESALNVIFYSVANATQEQLLSLADEIIRTKNDLRTQALAKDRWMSKSEARVRYDERFNDLETCLFLDGYVISENKLIPQDPSILDTHSLDDELTKALNDSGLPEAEEIKKKLNDSTDSFRRSAPNYNASLNDARIALQTLATSIAIERQKTHPRSFDKEKWGEVLAYLRASGFLTKREEEGLSGVFGFVSEGSHVALGLSEMEMARLGRNFVFGMCWFLIKRFTA